MARALIVLCLLLAGCGAEERPAATASSTSLVIVVDSDGDGPRAPEQGHCTGDSCPAVPRRAFEPVSKRTVCTDIFGGPQTASVEGTLRGDAISARFSRRNGCEIARWKLAAPLLDEVG